eukprot:s286_g26.t1
MWGSSTLLGYLTFLSSELRRKRTALGLGVHDTGLILMDRACVHSCATFKAIRDQWQKANNCLLVCDDSGPDGSLPTIPGGWGATGGPNDGFHAHFHTLRRSWLKVAVGQGSHHHLRKALFDLDISINGDPRFKLTAESSLKADAWALQQLARYQNGKLVVFAWVSRGLTRLEDIAEWHFAGNIENAKVFLERTRLAMASLLEIDDLHEPEQDPETRALVKESETSLLEDEFVCQWAIQGDVEGSLPIPLPAWFKPSIDRTILVWRKEATVWEERLSKRMLFGRDGYTPKQQEEFDEWKKTAHRRIILDKKRKCQVMNIQKQNVAHLRKDCIVLQIQLANEASDLKIRSGNGTYYQLKLLEVKIPATELPPEIDHFDEAAVADGNMAALGKFEESNHGDEIEMEECEQQPELGLDEFLFHDSDEDDEGGDGADGEGKPGPKHRVRAAEERPEFIELKNQGLTLRPANTSIGVHPGAQVWRGYCTDSTYYGRSWGGSTGRSPKQALLLVLRLVLGEHCKVHPTDHFARKQRDRVHDACLKEGVTADDLAAAE